MGTVGQIVELKIYNVLDSIRTACKCEDEAHSDFRVAIWVDGMHNRLDSNEQIPDDILKSPDFLGIADPFWIEPDLLAGDGEEQCLRNDCLFRSVDEGGSEELREKVTSHILYELLKGYGKKIKRYPWVSLRYSGWKPLMSKSSRQYIFTQALTRGAKAEEIIISLTDFKNERPNDRLVNRAVSKDIEFLKLLKNT